VKQGEDRMNDLEERIIKLESMVSFQDHTIEQLHEVIYRQQQELDEIIQKMSNVEALVKSQMTDEKRTLEEERPPHY